VLAIAGTAGGLHVLGAVAILGIGAMATHRAWRGDRARSAEPAAGPAAQPAASPAASSAVAGEQQ